MKRIQLAALLFAIAFPALAMAQGSGSGIHPPSHTEHPLPTNEAPFEVTRSFEGKILEIRLDSHVLVVEDKDGKRAGFQVDDQTAFKADKKTELQGRKKLKLEDFEKGQPVKVTFRASDNKVVEVRLRHIKS